MSKFIKLTEQSSNRTYYVNANSIDLINKDNDDDTLIKIREDWLYFKESPEEVMKLIEEKN